MRHVSAGAARTRLLGRACRAAPSIIANPNPNPEHPTPTMAKNRTKVQPAFPSERIFKEEIPVKLTDHDRMQRGIRAGELKEKLEAFDLTTKALKDKRAEERVIISHEFDACSKAAKDGEEPQVVELVEKFDLARMTASTFHRKSGDLIPERDRALEPDEIDKLRQGSLIPNGEEQQPEAEA